MTISEKPSKIEFTYIPDGKEAEAMKPVIVEFFYEDKIPYIRTKDVDSGEEQATIPVNFMVEVVDFLYSKGVSLGKPTARSTPESSTVVGKSVIQPSSIPVTHIEIKEEEEPVEKDFDSNQIPFSSFDVSQGPPQRQQPETQQIVVGGEIKEEDVETMKSRRVIKSNSAEESSMLRGEVPDKNKVKRS
ncbi:MAG TPA: hypothetical protein VMZ91_11170 [Candidatus Paceibacterota bacterium]|nr:hypothetical protein [Candidatus Paceibacterota bacterium]